MKKIVGLAFLSIGLVMIPSCKEGEVEKYHLTIQQTNDSISPDFPKDGEYTAGKIISFKVEIVTDVSFIPYLNNEKLVYTKEDGSVGGYKYYSFKMPDHDSTLAISGDHFYIDKNYSFNELYYWVANLNEDNVKGIKIEEDHPADNSYSAYTSRYSEKKEDIKYNLDILNNQKLVKANDVEFTHETRSKDVTFICSNDTEYKLEIWDGIIVWRDFSSSQCFRFADNTANYPDIITENN